MPIKSGFYFIMNVQAKNLAYLPNANSEEPVQCRYPRNDPGEQVGVHRIAIKFFDVMLTLIDDVA